MTSIERTAYPQFKRLTSARVLHVFFTPTAEETDWAQELARRMPDPDRKLGTLRPHDARHTFAYGLSQASGHNRAELERRLGHTNDRYLRLYTNPPDDIAADYVEDL
ncbi:hypothetical protein Pta02_15020 [Planobispora takensis]|uniref:Uncharacterized protein n=1 Tax=Planobispora takensis TaxID=1367882 RepID=A0A8J3T1S7_9ACTN|nr:hypothetical protein Pta02_15020 [Planobispora takensis]